MENLFFESGFKLSGEKLQKFERFCEFLLENNKKFNITAIKNREEVFLKHFVDSLKGAKYFFSGKKILEIGSGGGFPSIPLKINDESLDFTLIEATKKKCDFLVSASEMLQFKDFEVINARAEDCAKNKLFESFDMVTARAVASLSILSELCLPYLKIGGRAVFYKNYSEEEIDSGLNAIETLGCKISEIEKYSLNGVEGERCLIVIDKIKNTEKIYPREYKKILKVPL